MVNNIKNATDVYQAALKQVSETSPDKAQEVAGASFGDILSQSVNSAIDAQHNNEATSLSAAAGKADMTDVLQAVTDAEMTLNTVVAVRDRVISAYKEIMNMPI